MTGVKLTQQPQTACGVDVTARITTNGGLGTISYQWLLTPGETQPEPLTQSVSRSSLAGQHVVYVTVAVEGQGHGSASQTVTLEVLHPDRTTASITVVLRC